MNILDTCGRDTYALNQSLEFIRDSLNHFDVNQYECSIDGKPTLGTPRLKFNTTGPILGVIGGSYSTVSIQVRNYSFSISPTTTMNSWFLLPIMLMKYLFSLDEIGSESFTFISYSTNISCFYSKNAK